MRGAPGWDAGRMPSYLVESYAGRAALAEARECARLVAERGSGVRYVRTTFLPGDETVLHLFEAPSLDALRKAGRRAALHYERIVEAIEESLVPTEEDGR
jgi:hypothetical protein